MTLLEPTAPFHKASLFLTTDVFLANPHGSDVYVDSFDVSTAQEPSGLTQTQCGPSPVSPPAAIPAGARQRAGAASILLRTDRNSSKATVTVVWREGPGGDADQSVARNAIFRVTSEVEGSSCVTTVERL